MTPEQREIARANAQRIVNAGGTDAIDYTVAVGFLSLIAQVEALNRKNLELQRLYDERGLQVERLEVALQRAKVEALTVPQWIETANALPELDVPVLAIRNGCWGIGERYTRGDGGVAYRFNNTTAIGDRMKFECWIPLPVTPTIPAIPGTKEAT